MKKNLIILSIIVFTINQNVICQNIDALKNMTLAKIVVLERKGLDTFLNKEKEYREINVYDFKFYDFSYSTDSVKNNDTFYKLFFYKDTLKRVLFFDKIYSCKKPIYGVNISYIGKYRISFIYNMYLYQKLNWKEFNYVGFIVSDNKEKLNIFIGYDNDRNFNSAKDIDRIFTLDSNFVTKNELLIKSGVLRYITEPVRKNHEYKYEKSYKINKYIKIIENTKVKDILKLSETDFNALNYKILYMNGIGSPMKIPFRKKLYPLWAKSRILYYPCSVLFKNEKENKIYYTLKSNNKIRLQFVIDDKIRGELECFYWVY